ncbi:MAG: YigZ family protein [Campylobacterota bacterium]|nr:YigZ family protein [Campylobacterota bacterium]
MFTCKSHNTETLVIKQSKFIAHMMPYRQFDEVLIRLKEEHPKARHFVTAFRYLNEHEQVVEGSSDDGEPKGTSGKPSLHVLQGNALINSAVIIVRYFGGTKLGTGGLVRAYGDAVNLVIRESELIPYEKTSLLACACSYHDFGRVVYVIAQKQAVLLTKDFGTSEVKLQIKGNLEQIEVIKKELNGVIILL